MQEGVEESKVAAEENDDRDSPATTTMTETTGTSYNPATITTNHTAEINHFVQTILNLPKDSFADLAVWKLTGEVSTTTFREFIVDICSEQEMEDMDYDPNINDTLHKQAQNRYSWLLKGVRYAKYWQKNGLPHWDDPTKWDAGEFRNIDMDTLEGLPLVTPKSGAPSPGGTQAGTPA